jgi:hypothetical protein
MGTGPASDKGDGIRAQLLSGVGDSDQKASPTRGGGIGRISWIGRIASSRRSHGQQHHMKGMKGVMKGHEEGQLHLIGILGVGSAWRDAHRCCSGFRVGLHEGREDHTKSTTGNGKDQGATATAKD